MAHAKLKQMFTKEKTELHLLENFASDGPADGPCRTWFSECGILKDSSGFGGF